MASSKVMSSTSPANPDLPRHSTTPSSSNSRPPHSIPDTPFLHHRHNYLNHHQPPVPFQTDQLHPQPDQTVASPFGSMNMEEMLKNMYSEPDALPGPESPLGTGGSVGKNVAGVGGKTVDEVWKEIVTGGEAAGSKEPRMTLEDFLTKAGAVSEEDVRGAPSQVSAGYGMDTMMNAAVPVQFPAAPGPLVHMQNGQGGFGMETHMGFANGMVPAPVAGSVRPGSGGGGGRGKRRVPPVEDVALDKATQQKQRRMIKNRESAARSRERKQAYTVELESLVTQLEEENARLLRAEAEQKKERFKQLMENLIPVVEKRRPPRVLRRVQSMSW
ncbi:OLC1v1002536C2 [Oldenlandia corymbosa var. corymbosa]|uniref:OLC1v1002536C2 n=1 Tax=Oldenlandia corymbosa var. corymbosa TaxID=529605 RepID=A0AAV1D7U9_OLDCO|nr:OLC1v1002536C2 [Oldenlandia corymbosa var. corymbosa]